MAPPPRAKDLRVPPQNLEAERGLLGSLLMLNEAIDEIGDQLRDEHFYNDAHQKIYAAIHHLYERGVRGIDAVTLVEELGIREQLEDVGGIAYISQIIESVPHAAHARYYSDIVRNKYVQRSLIYACTDILQESYDSTDDTDSLLSSAEQRIFRILEQQETGQKVEMKDVLMDAFTRIDERLANDRDVTGISTGFTDLDHTTTGFQPAELIILAARPSMGKTALVCNIAEGVARVENKGVLIFSLEQSRLELAERFLCITAKINGHDLRAGNLSAEQRDRMNLAASELSELPMYLDDIPGRTGRRMSTDTILRLAQIPNVVALKDAAGDPAETSKLISEVDSDFQVYSGDDALTLSLLAIGAVGVVGVASHWAAPEMRAMISAFFDGDVKEATRLNQTLLASWDIETGDARPNPIPSKVMTRLLGLPGGQCRLPMGPEPVELEEQCRKVLSNLGRAGF